MRGTRFLTFSTMLLALAFPAGAHAADAWSVLDRAREQMHAQGPQLWSFEQTYLPSGFDRGEQESGRVALDLPKCVRWDYDDPYPKSFLLCDKTLWSWSSGDPAGHVYELDEAQPGLDLLLLAVPDLTQRYDASAKAAGELTRVQLVPKQGKAAALRDAAILVDKDGQLRELTYRNAQGDRTTFRFSNRRALTAKEVFTAPTDLKWQRETGGEQP
jgi:outer membrane lipoprotein-sorting protein